MKSKYQDINTFIYEFINGKKRKRIIGRKTVYTNNSYDYDDIYY